MPKLKVNFKESKKCWYCRHDEHWNCTRRFPVFPDDPDVVVKDCLCWIWAGRKLHDEETTNEDDAIINILGSMGNG